MARLSDVTLRARLIVAMAMSLLLLVVIGLSSLWAVSAVDRATEELRARWLPSVRLLSEIKYEMASHRLRFVRGVFTPDPDEQQAVLASAAARADDIAALMAAFQAGLFDPGERRAYAEAVAQWQSYLDEEHAIHDRLGSLPPQDLARRINGQSRLAFDRVNDAFNADIAFNQQGADRSGTEAVATFDRAMRLTLTLFGCALLLMAGFIVIVVGTVSRPIDRITEAMRRLAAGDRAASVAGLHGSNEIGRMATAVDVFRLYLVERDTARAALEHANEDLEDKVERRNAELRIANENLQQEIIERTQAAQRLKTMQEELVRTENLAAIGQLSAGIAHELNQPLAALGTLSENAVRFLERGDNDTVRFNLDRIVHLVQRMGVLTGRLRSFAGRSGGEIETIDVARSVDSALALLGHRIRAEVIAIDAPPTPVLIRANAIRFEQILVNLVGNALDATDRTAAPRVTISWGETADGITVRITDNGDGLTPEMAARVFEPFFTTKKDRGGLGLGLAISADIARSFGGSLTGAGRPEGGAVFTLTLPALR
ncbi:MAG: ATP-binding protein [Azospirillaceae bacterium]|nr:ATP-binding protein [Azospirillaceae bacterium]